MDKETKATIKQTLSSSLKFIAPKTSKLVFDDLQKLRKTKFGFSSSENDLDDGSTSGDYHKSYKQVISSNLANINQQKIDKDGSNMNSSDDNDDEPLLKSTTSSSMNDSSVSIPYFNSSASSLSNNRSSSRRRTITNNFYANNKTGKITNKLLLNSMKSNIEMQQKSTSALLNNISIISKFQQETTLSFYNDVSEKLAYIGNSIDNISRLYTEGENELFKTDRDNLISTIKSNGLMFSMLGSVFKENYNNPDKEIFDGVFKDSDAKKVFKGAKDKILGSSGNNKSKLDELLGRVKSFDDAMGNIPVNLNYWLNSMRGGSKFKKKIFGTEVDLGRLLGNAFGMDMKVDKRLSTNKYDKGPVAYNGIANRAITNVIPSLLSKILSTLNNKEELIYDYDEGKFSDKSIIREEREQRLKNTVKENLGGDIKNILGKDINAKDKELLEQVFYNMASEGKTISDYKGSLTGNKNLDKKIRDYYKDPKYRNSLNRNMFNTSTDMNEFFSEFSKDLAGQMVMDYSKNPYAEAKKDRRKSVKDSLESFEGWDESTSSNSTLAKILNGGLDKLNDKTGSKPLSGRNLRKDSGSIYTFNDNEDKVSGITRSSIKVGVDSDSTIAFLKTKSTGDSFNVTVKGGSLDSINGIVSTKENVVKDNNASYKDNLSKVSINREDDANDRSTASLNSERMGDEQNSRIASFEQRRANLLDDITNKIKDVVKNSPIGEAFGRAKLKAVNTLKGTKIGKVFGKFFSSPQAVEDAGMTPVYVMGSAVGGAVSGSESIGNTVKDIANEKFDLSGVSNFFGRVGGAGGNLLSSIGGKLSSKGGKLGAFGNLLSKSGGKLSSISAEKRAKAALKSGNSKILDKMLKEGYTEDQIADLAEGTTAGDLKSKALSTVKGSAKNVGGKLLSKGGSLATSAGEKLVTKGGMLGKAGNLLGSVGGKLTTSGAGMLAEGAATAGTTAGAGVLSSLGGAAASAGSALAGLAPILGPVAVAGLATFALVKIGPKIVNGIKTLGTNVLNGVKGLANKAKETAKGLIKGAGKIAKRAVGLGAKIFSYSPLGMTLRAGKGIVNGVKGVYNFGKNALGKAEDFFNGSLNDDGTMKQTSSPSYNTEDPTKSVYGNYNFDSSKTTATSGDGLGDIKSSSALSKLGSNIGGLFGAFGGKTPSVSTNPISGIFSKVSSMVSSANKEKQDLTTQKKLSIFDVKKKGKYQIKFPPYSESCIELIS